ncbi:hypothetical protein QYE76_051588 [Lolium multiflorum]|uniref:Integrase catalytic domain-containing protein n=1 Tax=Lolium multiflorum TaxID=4521 RepID=A0AAD8WIA7_LOLMU|nr:hypothetical protein QYE76_051588 [Lolium multiflorum]
MHDSPHPSKTIISSKRILELLHVDLFGPTTHASLGAKKHRLVIVDAYSRYTWVYFLKRKHETQQIFIDFATEVQRQHNLLIMAIRSDNGSEFKNYTLNDFLSDEGIRHQYSAAYTPQQNGVAERKNRTLMDMARSMMVEYKSRYNFWAEAISTACHSSNRLYLRKGLNKTPYEILTGNKPNISYFKVFGCKCFYKIKGVRLSKFAPKALEGIFVGYGAESHTYSVFDVSSGIIIESCSVKFKENDGSQVGQVDVCAGDEIPQDAIVRMGVGFFRPIEGHGVASREGLCSTTVEPSSFQHQQTPSIEANDAPTQEQEQDSPSSVQDQGQDQGQDQPRIHDGSDEYPFDICSSPNDVQDQAHDVEYSQEIEEAQVEGQDGDPNDQVDQVTPPRPRRTKEEIETRRLARRERQLERLEHTHDKVLGDLRASVTTRRQLANFSNHHAYISLVEPNKVFEALEDSDWLEAMLMTDKFEMSMMGEMKFFLGFEIKQLREGTFINQAKYLQDMLKRLKMTEMKGVATPMVTKCHLALDPNGASCSRSVRPRKRRGVPTVDDEVVEQDEVLPRATTARGASLANKKKGKKAIESYGNVRLHAYMDIRTSNPYLGPRSSRTRNRHFYTEVQESIFNEVYPPKVKVVDQRYINIDHLQKDAYFHEALGICEEFGLLPIMSFKCNYDPYLVNQFFATVYFHEDKAHSITWMTRDEVLTTTWSNFGQILGYPIPENCEDDRHSGWRFHGDSNASIKDVLEPLYMPGKCKLGFTSGLQPVYDIMLRIYRETIAVKVGNVDEIHSFVIDLMLQTHLRKGKGVKMDVMDCLWNQIFLRVVEKRSPAFAPYIMKLISEVWRETFDGAILEPISPLTNHPRKNLLIKDHRLPAAPSVTAAPLVTAADTSPTYL